MSDVIKVMERTVQLFELGLYNAGLGTTTYGKGGQGAEAVCGRKRMKGWGRRRAVRWVSVISFCERRNTDKKACLLAHIAPSFSLPSGFHL